MTTRRLSEIREMVDASERDSKEPVRHHDQHQQAEATDGLEPAIIASLLEEVERLRSLYEPERHSRTNPSMRSLKAAWDELPAFMAQHSALLTEVARLRQDVAERDLERECLIAEVKRLQGHGHLRYRREVERHDV